MAGNKVQKFSTTTTAAANQAPVAVLASTRIDTVIGSIIQLDGRQSFDPEGTDITFQWRFAKVPIGSGVESVGFKDLRPRSTAVSFIPDKTGQYEIELIVNDGELDSDPVVALVNIQLNRVPCGEGIVPDALFLWSYISNFWGLVEDREAVTSIWASTIQALGADIIRLWENDRNKSLATIQSTFQRRWLPYAMTTDLSQEYKQRVIVGKTDRGVGGETGPIGGGATGLTKLFHILRGPTGSGNKADFVQLRGNYGAAGRVIVLNDTTHIINRAENGESVLAQGADASTAGGNTITVAGAAFQTLGVQAGDRVTLTGINAGEYDVSAVPSETTLDVTYAGTATVPALTAGPDQGYKVRRLFSLLVLDEETLTPNIRSVRWRIPHLLHVPGVDLEARGVTPGDILVLEATRGDTGISAELRAQVVGVKNDRLGFEFTLQDLSTAATTVDRALFRDLMRGLHIVAGDAPEVEAGSAAEAFIAFMPVAINLATRPFSQLQLTIKAKKVLHNTAIAVSNNLLTAPALQEKLVNPDVVYRENFDYTIDSAILHFAGGRFSLSSPAPEVLWAECSHFDNSEAVENNFGRLVRLTQEQYANTNAQAPYLSAVRGLVYAFVRGPSIANVRLGVQILLGLPFTDVDGLILEIQQDFSTDSNGNSLDRILIEDLDDQGLRTGFRRLFFYPNVVGIETNPLTGVPYAVGDIISAFKPISKGVEVLDYVKDPLWWQRSLSGIEVLKYFVFKVLIDSEVFNAEDALFALDFVRSIKPVYTRAITTILRSLSEDVITTDEVAGTLALQFYDNTWGLEATARLNDDNQQGCSLWSVGSYPLATRAHRLLRDVQTVLEVGEVRAKSSTWDTTLLRGRVDATSQDPGIEGDLLIIAPGQLGSGLAAPGVYEIDSVIDATTVSLRAEAPHSNPTSYDYGSLDTALFEYGTSLIACAMRRMKNPLVLGADLAFTFGEVTVTSASAQFLTNGVSPGDHLIVEEGTNYGQYIITAIVPAVSGWITETQIQLVMMDGNAPIFATDSGVRFRVVRPALAAFRIENARSVYNGGAARMEIVVQDPNTPFAPFDVFTPNHVGLLISVSESDDPTNDGDFLITEYIHSGKVVTDSPSTTSDSVAGAVLHF